MNRIVLISMLALFTLSLTAQKTDHSEQIDRQVWIPFMQSYQDLDSKAFMKVHSDDIIRISRQGSRITVGQDYAVQMGINEERSKKSNTKRSIEFAFAERIHGDTHAFESGYYKVVNQRGDESPRTFYGYFEVVLKKRRWSVEDHGGCRYGPGRG